MKTLILPCAGQSSRYKNVRPKFLLTHTNGRLMLTESIRGLNPEQFDRIVIIALLGHEVEYEFGDSLIKEIETEYKIRKNKTIISYLPKATANQPETIIKGIKAYDEDYKPIRGRIIIKDCDNQFNLNVGKREGNFVAIADINKSGKINAGNKSYVQVGQKNTIVNIVEKQVISNEFCVGAYGFANVEDFKKYYEQLKDYENLYVSHIIYKMILDKHLFFTKEVKNYIDWGTLKDWLDYRKRFRTIFCDLDGVLVKSSSKHFEPKWGTTEGIKENIDILNKLREEGAYIVITTARPHEITYITEQQLKREGIKYDRLIMNLPHSQRILINDYSATNPYPSATCVNLERGRSLKFLLDLDK